MSKDVIEIDRVHAWQPRPYADSRYEAYLTCRVEGELMQGAMFYRRLKESEVQTLTRLFVHEYSAEPAHPFAARLETCKPIGPTAAMEQLAHPKWKPDWDSRWHVVVIVPFTD